MKYSLLKKLKKGVLVVIASVFLINSGLSNGEVWAKEQDESYANATSWMGQIDGEKQLSEITIPGTHDSGTQYVPLGFVMRCQNTSISEQLNAGYRYLDLRVAINEDKNDGQSLIIVHNFAKCHTQHSYFGDYLTFSDVCESVYDFLDENTSETVVLNIKIEDDEHSISDIQKFIHQEIGENADKWYTDTEIPTLDEVRGKIVLCTRFDDEAGYDETGLLLQWSDQGDTTVVDMPYELFVTDEFRLWVQDRYSYDVDDKYDAVIDSLENCEADENTIFLNFVSTSGKGTVGHPKGYAKQLNKLLKEYELKADTSYGIIIVDFGDAELAQHIYETN